MAVVLSSDPRLIHHAHQNDRLWRIKGTVLYHIEGDNEIEFFGLDFGGETK
jgi:hypothetical protein